MKVFGIVGWKDQGKTTLVTRLVEHISAQGLTVSTIKHAHHAFDVDQPGRDSYRHRDAGAKEVLLASRKRWALMHELRGEEEFEVDDLLSHMSPVDLVLIEGYKQSAHPKIEVYREGRSEPPIAITSESVVAIAGGAAGHDVTVPIFALDDVANIAAFIRKTVQI